MLFPVFNSSRSPFPRHTIDPDQLRWILRWDPKLRDITCDVRGGKSFRKQQLGTTCLGGPYRPLPPEADHGRCIPSHQFMACSGYRNTQHIDWTSRTGLVLVDMDDVEGDLPKIRAMIVACLPEVAVAWVSARGKGLKIGILVDPIPQDSRDNHDAWAAAYMRVVDLMTRAQKRERRDYRVDVTPAAAQVSILAHDPQAVVRVPSDALPWHPGDRSTVSIAPQYHPGYGNVLPAFYESLGYVIRERGVRTPQELIDVFPWYEGARSASMFSYGGWVAQLNMDREQARAMAYTKAFMSGMVAEYGIDQCLRHFDRGYQSMDENLLDLFPATG